MVTPIRTDSRLSVTGSNDLIDLTRRESIMAEEIKALASSITSYNKYRDYYDGRQALVIGQEVFKEKFGNAFAGIHDNWCRVVVDALADRLEIQGITSGQSMEREGESENDDDTELPPIPDQVWNAFRDNDIDAQQEEVHEGALVEGRSYVIVWPDEKFESGVRIDWNPAQLVRVRYSDDDWRQPVMAIKRWVTPAGDNRVNIYTDDFVYKYHQTTEAPLFNPLLEGVRATVPTSLPQTHLIPRLVEGEDWPLPNLLGQVPVVEFANRGGSELRDVIPLQDALNYLLLASLGGAGFESFRQRVLFMEAKEPVGGFSNEPGKVWRIPPSRDPDGKPIFGNIDEFAAIDLSGLKGQIEMVLQHVAMTTKTPVRMFFQSDRGGRGDAPSGESLLVEDEPLLDKVEKRQARFGNSWYQVARLVSKVTSLGLDRGEMRWKDPRAKYRASLLEDGVNMKKIGLPTRFIVRTLGFSPEEETILSDLLDEEEEKAEEAAQAALDAQQAVQKPTTTASAQSSQSSQPAQKPTSAQSS